MAENTKLDNMCINTLRFLAADAVERAKSGHPGMPMGAAAMAYVLWTQFLRHNPANPGWPGRDRFVLSAGHGSMLLYGLLHLTGYAVPLAELKKFRQWGSLTPGHPEYRHTPGVETTTGPLGQGFANAVGMALAERYLAAYFNRTGFELVDHFTYVLASDGEMMEGLSHEAAALAGNLKLGRLICLWDDNGISIEGSTTLSFTEDVLGRFAAYGWQVLRVNDGNSVEELEQVLTVARRKQTKPTLIAVRTVIGYGSPNKQGKAAAHGEPLGASELKLAKQQLGWPEEPDFLIPDNALAVFRQALTSGNEAEQAWQKQFDQYRIEYPELAKAWQGWQQGQLPSGWEAVIPEFKIDPKGMATRIASGQVLNAVAGKLFNLIGGSADLAPSTKTLITDAGDYDSEHYSGRNLHFGVREHGMGAILNGMALYGGLLPFGATFLVFADYMRPAIRLAALMKLKVIYIFTHDSIGLGEDGPTHQPVEHLAALRAIPGLTVLRPADANETAAAWCWILKEAKGPVALVLTRQNVPVLPPSAGLERGAYILRDDACGLPELILIGTGSEVGNVLSAADELRHQGVKARVVSMPSWELFARQPREYREAVLPPQALKLAVEAATTFGWQQYVGERGAIMGIDHFGASAPYERLYQEFGLTAKHITERALDLLKKHR
jgi:transketolase